MQSKWEPSPQISVVLYFESWKSRDGAVYASEMVMEIEVPEVVIYEFDGDI